MTRHTLIVTRHDLTRTNVYLMEHVRELCEPLAETQLPTRQISPGGGWGGNDVVNGGGAEAHIVRACVRGWVVCVCARACVCACVCVCARSHYK